VSGCGKPSLAFNTISAECQQHCVEISSPMYAPILDRINKPQVESIEGIPSTIAIDQTSPIRTARSTKTAASALITFYA